MTLDEMVRTLINMEQRAAEIGNALRPMAKLNDPHDHINLAWNATGGIHSAARATRWHVEAAKKEVLGG